jgi:hypothetical protein
MVKSKKNGSLVERAEFVDEYVEDDEEEYKAYLSTASK